MIKPRRSDLDGCSCCEEDEEEVDVDTSGPELLGVAEPFVCKPVILPPWVAEADDCGIDTLDCCFLVVELPFFECLAILITKL